MHALVQQLVNGVGIGSQYALWAVGYGLVFQVLGLMHFAHGDTLLLGLYMAFSFLVTLAFPLAVAIPILLLVAALLSVGVYASVYRPLVKRGQTAPAFIAALGGAFILRDIGLLGWGRNALPFPRVLPDGQLHVGSYLIPETPVIALAIALGVTVAFALYLKRARHGQAIVMIAQDREVAALMGIPVDLITALVYGISGVIGMVGAILFASAYGSVDSTIGFYITLKAFTAAMIGGIGRLEGAIFGGLLLGVLESLTAAYVSSRYVDVLVFGALVIVLLVRPTGFLGRTNVVRP